MGGGQHTTWKCSYCVVYVVPILNVTLSYHWYTCEEGPCVITDRKDKEVDK